MQETHKEILLKKQNINPIKINKMDFSYINHLYIILYVHLQIKEDIK